MKNTTQTTVVIGVIALIVGFLLGWFIAKDRYTNKNYLNNDTSSVVDDATGLGTEGTTTNPMNVTPANVEGSGSVSIGSQKSGSTVMVESATTDGVSWIAVREYNNGVMGNILGAKRLEGGAASNVIVPLLRATKPGSTYYVVLYKDNGDGTFDQKTDMMIEQDGKVISQPFLTDAVK